MLFNQIAVLNAAQTVVDPLPTIASLDEVYRSLVSRQALDGDYVVVDPGDSAQCDTEVLIDQLNGLLSRYPDVRSVVVISSYRLFSDRRLSALRQCVQAVASRHRKDCIVRRLSGWSSHEAISLYQGAMHCLFVDTHRVVDASMTGCRATLLASPSFAGRLSTDALHRCLSALANCEVTGDISRPATCSFRVVENRRADFHRALDNVTGLQQSPADWLEMARQHDATTVIPLSRVNRLSPFRSLADYRIRQQRKMRKLTEDPRSFLLDSRFRVLRLIGGWWPVRAAVGDSGSGRY